jgi:zinc protease
LTFKLGLAAFAAIVITAGAAGAAVFSPTVFTLPNGLTCVVVEDHIAPVVTQMVWYKVGSGDEARGKSGVAHFLEHLMFKGTKSVKPGQFSKLVAQNGGNDNAFTSWDYTAYFQSIAKDRLPLIMKLEADRMQNLQLSDATLLPEREVILAERRQTLESNPAARLNEAVDAAFYRNSAYHTPILGWRAEMEHLSVADETAWYKTWYAPNNAILVVSGDVTPAEVKTLAEKYYGPVPRKNIPQHARPQEPPFTVAQTIVLRDAQVRQPSIERLYPAPNYRTAKGNQAYALEVATEILGGDSASRLYNHLVVEQRLASSAQSGYSQDTVDPQAFMIYASPAAGIDIDKLAGAIDGEIAAMIKDGVTDQEVTTAKQRLVGQATLMRDSVMGPAQILGETLAIGETVDAVETWPDRINAVTVQDVDDAVKAILTQPATTGELLPLQGTTGSDEPAPMMAPASLGGPVR